MLNLLYYILIAFVFTNCNTNNESLSPSHKQQKGEYIYRKQSEQLFTIPPPQKTSPLTYSWEKQRPGTLPIITKEYFRCKGCSLNPARMLDNNGTIERLTDCSGIQKHSLPLRDSHEFIYTVLPELLNYIQSSFNKRVVITSGHRCPEHNTYVDSSKENQYSKHMIGAEVSFYIQGKETAPQAVVEKIMEYYKTHPKYKNDKEYTEFHRYEKSNSNVSTPPWYNKEVFVKIFTPSEGRNFDNRHPYPYVSIQVRYDRDTGEKVTYSWEQATRNYLRY